MAGSFLFHHLWESTVVAVLLVALARLPGFPTRLRLTLLTLAWAKFLVPTSLLALVAVRLRLAGSLVRGVDQALPAAVAAWLPSALSGPEGWVTSPVWAGWIFAAVWFCGVAVLALRWRRGVRRMAELVAAGCPPSSEATTRTAERLARRVGVRKAVSLIDSDQIAEPAVWGIRRPVVLLPTGLAQALTPPELEAVLLHELLHVARRDNLAATAERLLCCLFWFHPLVWRLTAAARVQRERRVDERVLALGGGSRDYARGLLKALRLGLGLGVPWQGLGSGAGPLGSRVQRILHPAPHRWSAPAQVLVLAASLLLVVGLTLVPLRQAVCPTQWASNHVKARPEGVVSSSPKPIPIPALLPLVRRPCSSDTERALQSS